MVQGMKDVDLHVGHIVRSRHSGKYGIVACVDYTSKADRYPTIDLLWEDGGDCYGFFMTWLTEDYDGMEFLDAVAPMQEMMELMSGPKPEIVRHIIDTTLAAAGIPR